MTRWRLLASVVLAASGLWINHPLHAQRPSRPDVPSFPPREAELDRKAPVVTAVAIDPGGKRVASAGDDHAIRLFDASTMQPQRQLVGHTDWIKSIAFSPDGQTLVSGGNDGKIIFWRVDDGKQLKAIQHPMAIARLSFHPQGKGLAVVGFGPQMFVYDLSKPEWEARRISCPCSDMRAVCYSADGKRLAASGRNGVVRVWDVDTLRATHTHKSHARRVRDLIFLGERVVSVSEDRSVHVWALNDSNGSFRLQAPTKLMTIAAYGPQRIVTGGSDNRLRFWDLSSRKEIGFTDDHNGTIAAVASRNQMVASGSFDTTLRLINATDVERSLRGQRAANISQRN